MKDFPWDGIVAAGIRTTSDGPFAEDTFFVFVHECGVVEIPAPSVDFGELGAHLPGLDWEKVIRAGSCTDDRVARIWHRDDSRSAPTTAELLARFASVIGALGGEASSRVGERLLAAWDEAGRRYHNREHLVECLRELDGCDPTNRVVELALWYHDAIYNPRAADNESRSADLLVADARELGIPPNTARAAAALIRATTHADAGPAEPDTALILDIDLSILGRDRLRFLEYDGAIRDELAHVPENTFRAARGTFLRSLLARPRLFRRGDTHARYEATARANLAAVLPTYAESVCSRRPS